MDTIFTAITSLTVLALGACIGSFLNVVVYRIPAGISLVLPPSRCPQCLHKLGKTENVPILGWLWLKGRCRHCRSPISMRYPLVEAATGLVFLLVFLLYDISLQTLGYWAFLSWLIALALIDFDTMTLPNPLTQSGLVAGLAFQVTTGLLPIFQSGEAINHLFNGIAGAVLGLWLVDSIRILGSMVFGQEAMGGGDPKLAAMMGVWLGWQYLPMAIILACAAGVFVGLAGRLVGRLQPLQKIVFGPFLALGAALTVFWGEAIRSAYREFLINSNNTVLLSLLLAVLLLMLIVMRYLKYRNFLS